jgi:hypothetical protein
MPLQETDGGDGQGKGRETEVGIPNQTIREPGKGMGSSQRKNVNFGIKEGFEVAYFMHPDNVSDLETFRGWGKKEHKTNDDLKTLLESIGFREEAPAPAVTLNNPPPVATSTKVCSETVTQSDDDDDNNKKPAAHKTKKVIDDPPPGTNPSAGDAFSLPWPQHTCFRHMVPLAASLFLSLWMSWMRISKVSSWKSLQQKTVTGTRMMNMQMQPMRKKLAQMKISSKRADSGKLCYVSRNDEARKRRKGPGQETTTCWFPHTPKLHNFILGKEEKAANGTFGRLRFLLINGYQVYEVCNHSLSLLQDQCVKETTSRLRYLFCATTVFFKFFLKCKAFPRNVE